MNAFSKTVEMLLRTDAYRATKFLSETATVKATQRHRRRRHDKTREVIITFGAPNYAEREFIRKCKRAGEPFPIKRVQLKFRPEARR